MSASEGDLKPALTAGVEPSVEGPERRSPASAVCNMNRDSDAHESPAHTTTPSKSSESPRIPGGEHRSPGTPSGPELDANPAPASADAVAGPRRRLHTPQAEPSYFSPQPVHPYGFRLPASAPASARPSPTASHNASTTSVNVAGLEDRDSPGTPAAQQGRRPSVQRDNSTASTHSSATVRPQSVDPFAPFSRYNEDGPHYPNQSYQALQSQNHYLHYPSSPYVHGSRPRGPNHLSTLSASHITTYNQPEHPRELFETGSRTVGNSPASSPGLFSPTTPPVPHVPLLSDGYYSSPWLHHTHRQAPKETHVADVDVDPISGRKVINQYEVMDELGRGVHGKVKLGRNLETGITVAIKIVDRYSKRRRLDKNTSREDKIKKEIAILKKARHPNIVSLLEVIDDPKRKKVYIVLEHVSLGEVKWRTEGEREICLIEWHRYQRESQGIHLDEHVTLEEEKILATARRKLQREQRQTAMLWQKQRRRLGTESQPWSLEFHGGDSEDEFPGSGRLSRTSTGSEEPTQGRNSFKERWERKSQFDSSMETPLRTATPTSTSRTQGANPFTGLEGTMYGAYEGERGRTPSVVESTSSHFTDEDDEIPEHFLYVPLLTLQAALETFRDTVLGLEYLHFQKVIHRDIKPANLLQTRDHRIKISDFGVSYLGRARQQTEDGDEESDVQDLGEAVELAKTVGTPAFYAPELCRINDDGDSYPVTPSIDIWALGVTLYCLIFGRVPFHDHNTFHLMKIIAESELHIPRYRLKAVTEKPGSRPSSHGRMYNSIPADMRAPHDLEYEEVGDSLRDLLEKLLTKDPRKRITIKDIKRHPWVLQGLQNFDAWVDETDPGKTSQGRRIEVSEADLKDAVVPITLIDRVRSGVRKTLDTVLGMGRHRSRRRAQSTATNPEQPPSISAHSSTSTMSQESRRPSVAAMSQSIFEALGRSKEPEHPLSQSVTASPEARDRPKFFESNSRTGSPANHYGMESVERLAPLAESFKVPPLERPRSTHSTMSSGASVRTIRQSDVPLLGNPRSPNPPLAFPGAPTALESPGGSNLGGILGGSTRFVNNIRSRERLKPTLDHSRAESERSTDTYDDPHSEPSIALSTALAAGHVDQPDVRGFSPVATRGSKASSRRSSVSSQSDYLTTAYATVNRLGTNPIQSTAFDLHHSQLSPTSEETSVETLQPGKGDNESLDRPGGPDAQQLVSALSQFKGSPSPDVSSQHEILEEGPNQESSDASPFVRPTSSKPLTSSSSEDHFTPISESASNPSIPSMVSGNSSVAAVPSDDSMNRYVAQAEYEGYGDDAPGSDDYESEEEFIVMGNKKPKKTPAHKSPIVSIEPRSISRSYISGHRRSAHSGSNGTVKKTGASDDVDQGVQDDGC